jgi:hypothetical protein
MTHNPRAPHFQGSLLTLPTQLEEAVARTLEVFQGEMPVVLLELPAVYALIAPGSSNGVRALDAAKLRRPEKTYGSIIGDPSAFLTLAERGALPPDWERNPGEIERCEGAFIRTRVHASASIPPALLRDGTHQGLLLPCGAIRTFIQRLEKGLGNLSGPERGVSILATSANLSGDPEGSITDEKKALAFAHARRLTTWIRLNPTDSSRASSEAEKGSYPILEFHGRTVWVRRTGPGLKRILENLRHISNFQESHSLTPESPEVSK